MKDHIVQEVRDARAAVAADFGYDLHKFFAWAKTHTAAERKAKHWLPTGPNKTLETTGGSVKSSVTRKRRVRPARVSA
jgi:N6-adenosine-specific RNA methylase IME4